MRALFVTPARLTELPDVPSASEAGFPDMNKIVGWTALMGPPGLPREVVEKWNEAFARLAKRSRTGSRAMRASAASPAIRTPAETEQFVREQYELYDKLVGTLGIRQ